MLMVNRPDRLGAPNDSDDGCRPSVLPRWRADRRRFDIDGSIDMQQLRHDLRLRTAASVIYDADYPGDE